jgi:hypothetical protein
MRAISSGFLPAGQLVLMELLRRAASCPGDSKLYSRVRSAEALSPLIDFLGLSSTTSEGSVVAFVGTHDSLWTLKHSREQL